MKKICITLLVLLSMMAARATVLYSDSGYPFVNGLIAGQDQWYVFYPSMPTNDAFVTNNILLLVSTNHDSVGTPTNGWVNPTEYNYASFEINVSQLPATTNGGYFAQFQDQNDTDDVCHVFIDTIGTTVPGTYRIGIANFATSFSAFEPPVNYPMDLATNVNYTVVMYYDTNQASAYVGCNLWIDPSESDYENFLNGSIFSPHIGDGYVYNNDTTSKTNLLDINITQIGFSPYVNAGISNLIVANTFEEVNLTNPPVFGIQPQSQTNNYSGNSTAFYAVASGVDVTYQWYSTNYGILSDGPSYGGATFVGSTSNTLVISNESASDVYYCKVTDAYNDSTNSLMATNDVITTPTAPFFTTAPVSLINNLFTGTGFTNTALGTGPLYYQWYFAPTNVPATYSALSGQTSPALSLNLSTFAYAGSYYVVASNNVGGGSIAYGPTNTLTVLSPTLATLFQLHNLLIASSNLLTTKGSSSYYINSNNVVVGGYVTTYGGFGSTYDSFYVQDASGYGEDVYLGGSANTNTPPVGAYVIITGPIVVYHSYLEQEPASSAQIVMTNAPVVPLTPVLANSKFNDFVTNGLGTNALLISGALVTFTNVYIYDSKSGAPVSSYKAGAFPVNGTEAEYFTIGQYDSVHNTNFIEVYQYAYYNGTFTNGLTYTNQYGNTWTYTNSFSGLYWPTNCIQLTGVFIDYSGTTPEIEPSRLADYVTNLPPTPTISISAVGGIPTITASNLQAGSTYSVPASTSLTGTWTNAAYGLGYWPTNVTFTDSNAAPTKFYRVSSP